MFIEDLIGKIQKGIEKNSVKSNLTYKKRNGESITETVYLKKSSMPFVGDWGRIYPVVKELTEDETKKIGNKWWKKVNWLNLIVGGRKNLYKLLFIAICLGGLYLFTTTVIGDATEFMNGSKYVIIKIEDFAKFCSDKASIIHGNLSSYQQNINLTN